MSMVLPCKSDHLSSPIGTNKPDPNGFRTQRKEKAMFSTGRTEGESHVQYRKDKQLHDVYANVELPGL